MVRKIVFEHTRALGDAIMFSAGIRDFKLLFPVIEINAKSNHPDVFKNNPYINPDLREGEGVENYKVGYPAIGNVNNATIHYTNMFLFDMIAVADLHKPLPMDIGTFCSIFANGSVGDPSLGDPEKNTKAREPFISLRAKYRHMCEKFSRQRGDIHLTDEEKAHNLIKELYGLDKYWVVAPGGKRDCTAKIWDWRQFQKVIDYFEGKIRFVTIGKSDLLNDKLDNVIDLTDKFNKDLRGLFSLVYHADGCVCGPSALLHLSASVPPRWNDERKPCVAVFGGREPTTWSWYCGHQILHTNGVWNCCDDGGCWRARVVPLPKDPKHNESLCDHTVTIDGKTVQACMHSITHKDVIRAIEKYYEGNIYTYLKQESKKRVKEPSIIEIQERKPKHTINMLGNLNTAGGGEQSLCTIASLFKKSGWNVNLYPWGSVHDNYKNNGLKIMPHSFQDGMVKSMDMGLPLLFYANDCIWDFAKSAHPLVDKVSSLIISINYCNGTLPKAEWLAKSRKVKAIIFQNVEKRDEFARDAVGFEDTELVVLYGAIDLNRFVEVCVNKRGDKDTLVILKHCVPDYRKYTTKESVGSGDKIHIWQKNVAKELDVKFYERLLKDTDNTRFEFMEAHKELAEAFPNNPRMIFHKWDSMPVTEFLSRGHIYLYRTSNMWRDQYPRTVAEALAAGLPVLSEPRDGTKDRIIHGNTGFYCIDYDAYLYAIKLLQRKEEYRHKMGMYAKDWARVNLDPKKWVETIENILS
jgi:ADP-heptose:LPS heptosyltransferase